MTEPTLPLTAWADHQIIAVFARAPWVTHGALRTVCRRFNTLLSSPAFVEERSLCGHAESGVVVAGGSRGGRGDTDTCWLLAGGRWRPTSSMRGARSSASSATLDGALWVCGGMDDVGATSTVERYDPRASLWRLCAPLSEARGDSVCGWVGGSLVVAGGMGLGGRLTSAEAYSPAAGRWAPLPPMQHDAYQAAACVLDGRLYVVGGMHSRRVQCWDGERWSVGAELPAERCYAACVPTRDGRALLVGGMVNRRSSASVLLYDPRRDAWEEGPSLPSPCTFCRAVEHETGLLLVSVDPPLRFKDGAWTELLDITGGPVVLTPGSCSAGSVSIG